VCNCTGDCVSQEMRCTPVWLSDRSNGTCRRCKHALRIFVSVGAVTARGQQFYHWHSTHQKTAHKHTELHSPPRSPLSDHISITGAQLQPAPGPDCGYVRFARPQGVQGHSLDSDPEVTTWPSEWSPQCCVPDPPTACSSKDHPLPWPQGWPEELIYCHVGSGQ